MRISRPDNWNIAGLIILVGFLILAGCKSTVAYYKKLEGFTGEQIDRCFDSMLQCQEANKGKGYCVSKTPNYEPLAEGKPCFIVKLAKEVTKETVRAGRAAQKDMESHMTTEEEANEGKAPINTEAYEKMEGEPAVSPDPIILKKPEPKVEVVPAPVKVEEQKTQAPAEIVKEAPKKKSSKKHGKKGGKKKSAKKTSKKAVKNKAPAKKAAKKTGKKTMKAKTIEKPAIKKQESKPEESGEQTQSMPSEMDLGKPQVAEPSPKPQIAEPSGKPAIAAPEKPAIAAPETKTQETKPQIAQPEKPADITPAAPVAPSGKPVEETN